MIESAFSRQSLWNKFHKLSALAGRVRCFTKMIMHRALAAQRGGA